VNADQTRCQRRGGHDWGAGPLESAPLTEGEVQRCADCTLTRWLSDNPKRRVLVYGRG